MHMTTAATRMACITVMHTVMASTTTEAAVRGCVEHCHVNQRSNDVLLLLY
jgi:hypothetical protein